MNTDVQAICQRYLEQWRNEYPNYESMIKKCCGDRYILCNELINAQVTLYYNRKRELAEWNLYCGNWFDEDGNFEEFYQYFIISEHGAEMLRDYTNEVVQYNAGLDLYLLCVSHWGTAWDYVPANWKEFYKDYNPDVNVDVDDEKEEVF